jgi:hypothetical protein
MGSQLSPDFKEKRRTKEGEEINIPCYSYIQYNKEYRRRHL